MSENNANSEIYPDLCKKGDKEIKGDMEIIHCNLQNFRMNLSPYLHNPHISFSYTISTFMLD
ncbi:MAG: hypothetical protein AB1422_12325 [bacterium]